MIPQGLPTEESLNKPFAAAPLKLSNTVSSSLQLTDYQKTIIAGSLLGDASLKQPTGNFKNSRLQMKHSLLQHEWIAWKAAQLISISGKKPFHIQEESVNIPNASSVLVNKTPKLNLKAHYQSRALKCLTDFQEELSTNNLLDFNKPWLFTHVNSLGLCVWWLDDGGLIGTGKRRGRISTHGFSDDSQVKLQQFLLTKFNIKTNLASQTTNNRTYKFLELSPKMLKRLLCLVLPHIPVGSMLYKANINYSVLNLQQHWIATMHELVRPELRDSLTQLVGPSPNLQPFAKTLLKDSYTPEAEVKLIKQPSQFIDIVT